MESIKAWHFITPDMKLRDGTKVSIGSTTEVEGKPIPERCGLHASTEAMNALFWAKGLVLCRVELSGDIVFGERKIAANTRKILYITSEKETLDIIWKWSSLCAINIINNYHVPVEYITILKEVATMDIAPSRLTFLKPHVRKICRKIWGQTANGKTKIGAEKMPVHLHVLGTICLSRTYYNTGEWWQRLAHRPDSWPTEKYQLEEQLLEAMIRQ